MKYLTVLSFLGITYKAFGRVVECEYFIKLSVRALECEFLVFLCEFLKMIESFISLSVKLYLNRPSW